MPINTKHPSVIEQEPYWQRCRDVFAGEDVVKSKKEQYLPLLEGQTTTEDVGYKGYLARAMFFPAFERTVSGLVGTILRKPPIIVAPAAVSAFVDDLMLTRDTFQGALVYLLGEVLSVGRLGLFADWNDALERPYWTEYEAESIVNWSETKVQGERKLEWLVLKESVPVATPDDKYLRKIEPRYRELYVQGQGEAAAVYSREWRVAKTERGEDWTPSASVLMSRRGKPVQTIPFVCVGPRRVSMDVAKPPLLDLANLNLSHYRSSADLEHGRHFTALPTPWITGWAGNADGSPMKIGSGTAWIIPTENAEVGMLEFTGQGLQALEKALESKERLMAVVGARMLEERARAAETAEALRLRQAGEHASLSSVVTAASSGLTVAMQWFAFWLGIDAPKQQKVQVSLSRDFFETRLSPQEAEALTKLWQASAISYETLFWNLQQGEWTRPGVTWEDEQLKIMDEELLNEGDEPEDGAGAEPPDDEPPAQTGEGQVQQPGLMGRQMRRGAKRGKGQQGGGAGEAADAAAMQE